jgi:hypothetical protein
LFSLIIQLEISGLHKSIFTQPFSVEVYTPEFFYSLQYMHPRTSFEELVKIWKKTRILRLYNYVDLFLVEISEIQALLDGEELDV